MDKSSQGPQTPKQTMGKFTRVNTKPLANAQKVAEFSEEDVERLLQNEGIIRNRLKITSAIKNAKLFANFFCHSK